ncbi:BRO-N domain-containing protein [Shouchella clausii]|uniref:BRO-N domain-containing protein n=1 Tax=Shouchella clausii TaxID=79880 RepID=UPI001C53159D|nr:BRO family protein [Shouchella clausii]
MNQLQEVFSYGENRITTLMIENQCWFLAKDICQVLEHTDVSKACARLDHEDKLIRTIFVSGQNRPMMFINESGLYQMILTSRKPEAKRFKRWVTSEVLPAIRKTGTYSVQQPQTQLEILQQSIEQMVLQEKRLSQVEKQQANLAQIITLNPNEWRKKVNAIMKRIGYVIGGSEGQRAARNISYDRLEERARCDLSIRLVNKQRKMAYEGVSKSKIAAKNRLDVIADDARLTEIYLAVVKDMAIEYKVDISDLKLQEDSIAG